MTKLPKNIGVTAENAAGRIVRVPSQKQLEKQFEPYAIELGKLVYAWNRLHEKLFGLFWAVTGLQNGNIANAIWHSIDSDRAQRQMLRKAAQVVFAADTKKKDGVNWLNQVDQSLAGNRNDAIHAPLAFLIDPSGTKLVPSRYSGHPRGKGMEGKELVIEFKWYRERAHAALRLPERRAWPDIPDLPRRDPTRPSPACSDAEPK